MIGASGWLFKKKFSYTFTSFVSSRQIFLPCF